MLFKVFRKKSAPQKLDSEATPLKKHKKPHSSNPTIFDKIFGKLFYRIALEYTIILRNEASPTDEKDNLRFNMTEFEKRLQRKAGQQ